MAKKATVQQPSVREIISDIRKGEAAPPIYFTARRLTIWI